MTLVGDKLPAQVYEMTKILYISLRLLYVKQDTPRHPWPFRLDLQYRSSVLELSVNFKKKNVFGPTWILIFWPH